MQSKSPATSPTAPKVNTDEDADAVTVVDVRGQAYTKTRRTSSIDKGHDFLLKSPSEAKQEFNPKKILNIRVPQSEAQGDSNSIESQVFSLRYSPNSECLAASFGNGIVRIYNCKGECIYAMNQAMSGGAQLPSTAVTFRPYSEVFRPSDKNICLVAMADGSLQHWDVDECNQISSFKEDSDNEVHAVDFRHDGFLFATVGRDAAVRVYDETAMKQTNKWSGSGCHSDQLFAVKWLKGSKNILMTAGWDDRIKVGILRRNH